MSLPYIWKSSRESGTYIDLATFLLENRTIFVGPNITSEVASLVIMQMMALAQQKGEISLYLNSNSGSASAGLAIVDMINAVSSPDTPINTYCIGECKGIATAILVSGWEGERRAFPSARISLYQDWYNPKGLRALQTEDASERERLAEAVQEIFVKRTNAQQLTLDRLRTYIGEPKFISSSEAVNFGVIDEISGIQKNAYASGV